MRLTFTLAVALLASSAAIAPAAELAVGDPAPDFKLAASDGKTYQLSDFKGKKPVVIAWFPKAFTTGCTIECKSLAANGAKLRQFDVAYFMASVDTPEKNADFAKQEEADFPMLSDPQKTVASAYGVLSPRGVANRWTFYIAPDGTIQYIDKQVNVNSAGQDLASKLADLKVKKK
jgi:thioredoxin-dependent peroxiredoxin